MTPALITVDVEALPARAACDHVSRLVYGSFGGHPPMGLREMMAEAEKRAMQLTCFFDYCEYDRYGEPYLDVAREIAARGHELQLHAHPEVMRPETWARLGLDKPETPLDRFSEAHAERLFDWLLELHARVTSVAPMAFRGGGYRNSASVLAAMRSHGLQISSNHNPGRPNQFDGRDSCELFRHANGVLEVPISVLESDGTRSEFNFNQFGFEEGMDSFPGAFDDRYGDRAVLNLVMHSRSFLVIDDRKRFYVPRGTALLERYRRLLDRLRQQQFEVTGIARWAAALPAPQTRRGNAGTAPPPAEATPRRLAGDAATAQAPVAESAPAVARRAACPVCGDPKRRFVEFNGRRLARCAACGALERQRSLVQAWNTTLHREVPTLGRAALMVSPAKSERRVFDALGFASVRTLDIRPEAGCDIVADLCAMPQVPDASFDVVFASHVLPHVHDLDAALSEIARILTPDGVFLSFTPVHAGRPTTLADGSAAAAGWYGQDLLQKLQVGSFRAFGDLGLLRDLQRHFVVKTVYGLDPVTDNRYMWTCAWRLSAADRARALPGDGVRYQ